MPGIQLRAPDGRRWTLKELVQGRPLGHPSHPMFVHFPISFYIAALVFDVASRFGKAFGEAAPNAATWLIAGAFIFTLAAVVTGLVDYLGMVKGSTRKRWATRHLVLQVSAASVFVVNFAIRFSDRSVPNAKPLWIVLDAIGVLLVTVGQYLGGVLVYEFGMRVRTVERGEAARAQSGS